MTNPLIPNTFVPGTKAKAQEVNANFIALAEEIQETQTNAKEQFTQLRTEIDEKMDLVAQNYAQTDLVNTNAITNTILGAPNGVVECDNQTITVKSGVKILIPNGKTSDGKLENLEYATEHIISKTATNLTDIDTAVFLYNTGDIDIVPQKYIFYKSTTPVTLEDNVHWYNMEENKWYKYISSESRWSEIFAIPIANVSWDKNSVISKFNSTMPINLIKASDLNNFYTLKGVLPQDLDYVVERYAGNWDSYTIYKSGWVKQSGYAEGKGDTTANFFVPMKIPYMLNLSRLTAASNGNDVGMWFRGDPATTYIKIYSPSSAVKIWNIEGYMQNPEEV